VCLSLKLQKHISNQNNSNLARGNKRDLIYKCHHFHLGPGASSEHNFNNKPVHVFPKPQSWHAAERTCGEYDEKLVTLKNEEDMFCVERQLNSYTNRSLATFWIGGREIKSQWVWSHGKG
jgi:hypothetical protein